MKALSKKAAASAEKVRKICLGFPGAIEKEAWRAPTFRTGGKMFAMFVEDHHGDGRLSVWCIAPPDAQRVMVADDPKTFFVPPYVGPKGWIGVRLDTGAGWKTVSAVLKQAYRWVASQR